MLTDSAPNTSSDQGVPTKALDLFEGLPEACSRSIEERSKVGDFRAGHVFFRPGQRGEVLFLLEKGEVQTFRTSGSKKLIIAELKAPAVFGEMGCVGQGVYYCCAQATEPARIRLISRSDLDALLEKHPIITRRLLDLVSRRFVRVLMDLDATSSRNLIPRLAGFLLERMEIWCATPLTKSLRITCTSIGNQLQPLWGSSNKRASLKSSGSIRILHRLRVGARRPRIRSAQARYKR